MGPSCIHYWKPFFQRLNSLKRIAGSYLKYIILTATPILGVPIYICNTLIMALAKRKYFRSACRKPLLQKPHQFF